jgi:nitroreductase
MNTILNCLSQHRSIRSYAPTPIADNQLDAILHAATRASSSGNMQTYSIIVTKDADARRKLWEFHFEQDMINQAPVLLTFCADWNRMIHWCNISDADPGYDNFLCFVVAAADAFIAAQNAAAAAESLGLGICYMGTTLCCAHKLIEFFECPKYVMPVTTLVVGQPNEDPELRARLPIESIVHSEKYEAFDDSRIRATYEKRETEGWKRYEAFPEMAERMKSSGVKNLAQVYTQLKYTRDNNQRFSRDLIEALEKQGFWNQ